jgi:uncharacterized protein (DUF1697 family)
MVTHVALLRGINVSGQKKIRMADLRGLLEQFNVQEVQTYIQSGNILFQSPLEATALRQKIFEAIAEQYGFHVPVQVISAAEWLNWADQNPFLPEREEVLKSLHLTILEKDPGSLGPLPFETQDQFVQRGRLIYLYCPDGYGRSKLTNTFWERKAGCAATTRNWKTVRKLAEMAVKGN